MSSDLSNMAKAFGVSVAGLAKISGFSRGGLYVRRNTHRNKLDAARKALKRYSYSLYKVEVANAKKNYEKRKAFVEKMFGEVNDT